MYDEKDTITCWYIVLKINGEIVLANNFSNTEAWNLFKTWFNEAIEFSEFKTLMDENDKRE